VFTVFVINDESNIKYDTEINTNALKHLSMLNVAIQQFLVVVRSLRTTGKTSTFYLNVIFLI